MDRFGQRAFKQAPGSELGGMRPRMGWSNSRCRSVEQGGAGAWSKQERGACSKQGRRASRSMEQAGAWSKQVQERGARAGAGAGGGRAWGTEKVGSAAPPQS
eukprot:1158250-Pelagomonas_calceolata.AAC.1